MNYETMMATYAPSRVKGFNQAVSRMLHDNCPAVMESVTYGEPPEEEVGDNYPWCYRMRMACDGHDAWAGIRLNWNPGNGYVRWELVVKMEMIDLNISAFWAPGDWEPTEGESHIDNLIDQLSIIEALTGQTARLLYNEMHP